MFHVALFCVYKDLRIELYFVVYPENLRLNFPSSTGAYDIPKNSQLRKQYLLRFREGILVWDG